MTGRAAIAALLGAGLAIGGCGGGDDDEQGSSATSRPTTGPDGPAVAPPTPKQKPGSKPRRRKRGGGDPLEDLPPARRAASIKTVVETIAGLNGLRNAVVTVSGSGRVVEVSVPPASACTAGRDAGTRTADQVEGQIGFVTRVAVSVGGRSFAAYRSACRPPILPGGSGRVVYARQGAGVVTSPKLKITAKRWTIAYRNDGGYFQVFPVKGGKPHGEPISHFKRAAGKLTLTGPGTFELRISGGGPWAITVRDGA